MKVLYIVSFLEKSFAFEWVVKELVNRKVELSFVLIGNVKKTPMTAFLEQNKIPFTVLNFTSKQKAVSVLYSVFKILRKTKPEVVHVHLFDAGRLSLPVAWFLRIRKRIYTRHYSTFHHDYFPKAVVFDRLINFFATDIVSISDVVTDALVNRENVSPSKIKKITHGFDFNYFKEESNDERFIKEKYGLTGPGPVVGAISRYIDWKGVPFIIDAFVEVRKIFPSAHLVLANANGPEKAAIQKQLKKELPSDAYTEILFEENIRALYTIFDVFVHVPKTATAEAFGQTYIEALAMRVPSVFTLSGIAGEFIDHGKNALVVNFSDSKQIAQACIKILQHGELGIRLGENGYKTVTNRFDLDGMIAKLCLLYNS